MRCLVGRGLLAVLLAVPATGWTQYHTQRGAVVGGLTGAAAGAVIGDNSDKAGAGALIGGALGLLAGGALGNTVDQEDAYARAWQYQQYQQYSQQYNQQYSQQVARAVSIADVVTMSHQQIGDGVIISTINTQGIQRPLEVPDIIQMHQQGVSDVVITAMQRAPVAGVGPVVTARPASPVIVREYYAAPRAYYHRPTGYHYHGCGPRGW